MLVLVLPVLLLLLLLAMVVGEAAVVEEAITSSPSKAVTAFEPVVDGSSSDSRGLLLTSRRLSGSWVWW